MDASTPDLSAVLRAVESLRAEVARMNDRLAALEASGPPGPPVEEARDEELVMVLTAAIAAYLGVKPRIRQIRLLGSQSWAQYGRATVQASHALTVHHG